MNKAILFFVITAMMVNGCMVGFSGSHHRGNVVIVPPLPFTIEIGNDQFYEHHGYYFRYQGNVWVYSQSRVGPWIDLPRSHYPRKVHYRYHEDRNRNDRYPGRNGPR